MLLGPGYFVPVLEKGSGERELRLAPGHLGLLLYTTVFLIWYAVNYRSAMGLGAMPTETSSYPALFYGLLSLLLITYLLPGFAFFLDRYRIPVVLSILIATVALYGTFGTDHFYELNPRPERTTSAPVPILAEIYDNWQFPSRSGRAANARGGERFGRWHPSLSLDRPGPYRVTRAVRGFVLPIDRFGECRVGRERGIHVLLVEPGGRTGGV